METAQLERGFKRLYAVAWLIWLLLVAVFTKSAGTSWLFTTMVVGVVAILLPALLGWILAWALKGFR